jgi:hypothetical protein
LETHCQNGLVNSDASFINFIDSRCVPYTWPELILFGGGCLLWVLAYGIIVRNAFKLRFVEMAAIAGFSNFAWEFVWSFLFRTDMGWFLVYTYRAWWFLDIVIIWKTFEYGADLWRDGLAKTYFKPFGAACILGFGLIYYFFTKQGLDEPIGATTAYLCQLVISWCCLWTLLANPTETRFSMTVGWLRSYGTGMNTVFMFLHYPANHLVHTLGVISFVLDNLYLWILWQRLKQPAPRVALATA